MVQRSLELRDDQVFNNIQKYGNTTAASIPLCLDEADRGARREARRPGGAGAFGGGFTWASARYAGSARGEGPLATRGSAPLDTPWDPSDDH